MQESKLIGSWLDSAQKKAGVFRTLLFVVLAVLVLLNFVIRPHEAEFAAEAYPAFWALFALIGAIVMVFVLKKIIYPLLARQEEDSNDRH